MTEAEATALERTLFTAWTGAGRAHGDAMRTGHQCPQTRGESCPARETASDLFALWSDAATDANAIRSFPDLVAALNQPWTPRVSRPPPRTRRPRVSDAGAEQPQAKPGPAAPRTGELTEPPA